MLANALLLSERHSGYCPKDISTIVCSSIRAWKDNRFRKGRSVQDGISRMVFVANRIFSSLPSLMVGTDCIGRCPQHEGGASNELRHEQPTQVGQRLRCAVVDREVTRSFQLKKLAFERDRYGLSAIDSSKFGKNMDKVSLYCALHDSQMRSDFLVAHALGD